MAEPLDMGGNGQGSGDAHVERAVSCLAQAGRKVAMLCPKCGLINPESAVLCDCGYDFSARTGGVSRQPSVFAVWRGQGLLWRLLAVAGLVAVVCPLNLVCLIATHIGVRGDASETSLGETLVAQAVVTVPIVACWVAMLTWPAGGILWGALAMIALVIYSQALRGLGSADALGQLGAGVCVAAWLASQAYLPMAAMAGERRQSARAQDDRPRATGVTPAAAVSANALAQAGRFVALASLLCYLGSLCGRLLYEPDVDYGRVTYLALLVAVPVSALVIAGGPRSGRPGGHGLWLLLWLMLAVQTAAARFWGIEGGPEGLLQWRVVPAAGPHGAGTWAEVAFCLSQIWAWRTVGAAQRGEAAQ